MPYTAPCAIDQVATFRAVQAFIRQCEMEARIRLICEFLCAVIDSRMTRRGITASPTNIELHSLSQRGIYTMIYKGGFFHAVFEVEIGTNQYFCEVVESYHPHITHTGVVVRVGERWAYDIVQ